MYPIGWLTVRAAEPGDYAPEYSAPDEPPPAFHLAERIYVVAYPGDLRLRIRENGRCYESSTSLILRASRSLVNGF